MATTPVQTEVVDYLRRRAEAPIPPAPLTPEEQVDLVDEFPIGEAAIPVRVYAPRSETPLPVVVYYHGGGWVMGDLDMHDRTCRRLSTLGHCVVVNVGYRLAPVYPFPTPLDDCYDALVWAATHAASIGGDPERLGVAGSSAGGNLAAAVALRARDAGYPVLGLQILIYPVLDSTMATPSYTEHRDALVLTAEAMAGYWSQYVPAEADRTHPYASPTFAESLAGLPPTLIATADHDPLCDEALDYAARLRADGVAVTAVHYEGQVHGFLAVSAGFRDSTDLCGRIADFVDQALHTARTGDRA